MLCGIYTVLLLIAVASNAAAVEPHDCTEDGLDEAIAEGAAGDPGPHTFDCAIGADPVEVMGKHIADDLILDGGGRLALECVHPNPAACDPLITIDADPAPVVTLSRLDLLAGGIELGESDVTLRSVKIIGTRRQAGVLARGESGKGATLSIDDCTISGSVVEGVCAVATTGFFVAVTVERSTITGNSGVGLWSTGAIVDISNSTISGNGGGVIPRSRCATAGG